MPNSIAPASRLERALQVALAQYEETAGQQFPANTKLRVIPEQEFWASVEQDGDLVVITVTTGVVETLVNFWTKALENDAAGASGQQFSSATADDFVHLGLVWLMLHELHHYDMGHFKLLDRMCLTEAKDANSFDLAARKENAVSTHLRGLDQDDLLKVEPCLEMQADHDAIEMLLDAYSGDNWREIRIRAAAIAAMMILIEVGDKRRGHALSSHPKAATRLFQLLGHVIEMPFIEAILAKEHRDLHLNPAPPSKQERKAFNRSVIIPSFYFAAKLAVVAKASDICSDLEDASGFFVDLHTARTVGDTYQSDMITQGGKQWNSLARLNASLLRNGLEQG